MYHDALSSEKNVFVSEYHDVQAREGTVLYLNAHVPWCNVQKIEQLYIWVHMYHYALSREKNDFILECTRNLLLQLIVISFYNGWILTIMFFQVCWIMGVDWSYHNVNQFILFAHSTSVIFLFDYVLVLLMSLGWTMQSILFLFI